MFRVAIQLLFFTGVALLSGKAGAVEFDAAERELIAQHGPWPMQFAADSSNRVSENEQAIRLGEALFFDHELGIDSKFSCASCHDPGKAFSDGLKTAQGRVRLDRNTPSLLNLKANRWFGWGGENDSLWAQSIRPILAADEMANHPDHVRELLLSRPRYRQFYLQAFATEVGSEASEQVLVNVGKALAAYQESLVSQRTEFDDFRDALLADDREAMSRYPENAQRGLRIFIGAGRCNLCHLGPRFSNGEFGDVGIPYFTADGVDAGRYGGIQQVRVNPYNLLGKYNDGDAEQNAVSSSHVRQTHRNWGEFKIPGLRAVAATAPYMHNGSLPTLRDVVLHYSNLDEERLHTDGEKILRPLKLSDAEVDDLVSFLRSLGEE
jgi:cytochrome c peroxidase